MKVRSGSALVLTRLQQVSGIARRCPARTIDSPIVRKSVKVPQAGQPQKHPGAAR